MKYRILILSLILPCRHIHVILVIPLGFSFGSLALYAEVTAAGLIPVKGVTSHKFTYLKEICKPEGFLEFLIEFILCSWNPDCLPEFSLEGLDFLYGNLQAFLRTSHSNIFPHDITQFLMDNIYGFRSLHCKQFVNLSLYGFLGFLEFRSVGVGLGLCKLM